MLSPWKSDKTIMPAYLAMNIAAIIDSFARSLVISQGKVMVGKPSERFFCTREALLIKTWSSKARSARRSGVIRGRPGWSGPVVVARRTRPGSDSDRQHQDQDRRSRHAHVAHAHGRKRLDRTDVAEGNAEMIVTAVGDASERGKLIKEMGKIERERTPLEQKLDDLADLINVIGTAAAALIFASIFGAGLLGGELGGKMAPVGETILLIIAPLVFIAVMVYNFTPVGRETPVRTIVIGWITVFVIGLAVLFIWGTPLAGAGSILDNFLNHVFSPLLRYFMLAVTIIVVSVPEGLPMAITISLALSAQNIKKDNNLVRKMIATETIGSANVICSDKTGTLTLNQMSVEAMYLYGKSYLRDANLQSLQIRDKRGFEKLIISAAVNSTGNLQKENGVVKYIGSNATENSLLKWLDDEGVPYQPLREKYAVIERRLWQARPHPPKDQLFLYDVTSSYVEGDYNALAAWGYNRDHKEGKKQVVVGLLTDSQGEPVSIQVYRGNTSDLKTFGQQVHKIKKDDKK